MSDIVRSDNDDNSTPQAEESAFRNNVYVPDFFHNNPRLWFCVIEAQFNLLQIDTDDTKYNYIIANLNYQALIEIEDVIINPPTYPKYEHIKIELIGRFAALREQQLCQVLEDEEIGNRKPSEFLQHLRSLVESPSMEELVRSFWLKKLPDQILYILSPAIEDSSLDSLAEMADVVSQVMPWLTKLNVEALSNIDPASKLDKSVVSNIDDILGTVSRHLEGLKQSLHKQPGADVAAASPAHSKTSSTGSPTLCWYHVKFGTSAKKCIQPCIFSAK